MGRHLFLLLCFLLFTSLVIPPRVFAFSPTLSISPAKYDLHIVRGQVQQTNIKITNRSEVALPIHVEVMDFAPKDEQGGIDYGKSLPGRSATSWFHLNKQDMILSPGEAQPVEVTISPPDSIHDGSYFAMVMFQPSLPSNYVDETNQTQAKIIPWIGSLFLLRYGDLPQLNENSLTITRFQVPPVSTDQKIPLLIEVKNNTAFHLAPEAEFELKSLRGPIKAKVTTKETTILPGSSRIFQAELAEAPPLGFYKTLAKVRVLGYQKYAPSKGLMLLTWQAAAVALLILLILGLKIRHRKRIFAAVKALLIK